MKTKHKKWKGTSAILSTSQYQKVPINPVYCPKKCSEQDFKMRLRQPVREESESAPKSDLNTLRGQLQLLSHFKQKFSQLIQKMNLRKLIFASKLWKSTQFYGFFCWEPAEKFFFASVEDWGISVPVGLSDHSCLIWNLKKCLYLIVLPEKSLSKSLTGFKIRYVAAGTFQLHEGQVITALVIILMIKYFSE